VLIYRWIGVAALCFAIGATLVRYRAADKPDAIRRNACFLLVSDSLGVSLATIYSHLHDCAAPSAKQAFHDV
jgi:uncharacterized integral membrane protein